MKPPERKLDPDGGHRSGMLRQPETAAVVTDKIIFGTGLGSIRGNTGTAETNTSGAGAERWHQTNGSGA